MRLLLTAAFIVAAFVNAQFNDTTLVRSRSMSEYMITAQPGYYIGPYTIMPGNWQVESQSGLNGFDAQGQSDGNLLLSSIFLRYGVSDFFEIRARHNYNLSLGANGDFNVSNLTVGGKANVMDAKWILPKAALLIDLNFGNTGSQANASNTAISGRYAGIWPAKNGKQNYYIVLQASNFSREPQLTYTQALAAEQLVWQNSYVFVENFNSWNNGSMTNNFTVGIYSPINKNLQWDLSYEFNRNPDGVNTMGIYGGISFRYVHSRYLN